MSTFMKCTAPSKKLQCSLHWLVFPADRVRPQKSVVECLQLCICKTNIWRKKFESAGKTFSLFEITTPKQSRQICLLSVKCFLFAVFIFFEMFNSELMEPALVSSFPTMVALSISRLPSSPTHYFLHLFLPFCQLASHGGLTKRMGIWPPMVWHPVKDGTIWDPSYITSLIHIKPEKEDTYELWWCQLQHRWWWWLYQEEWQSAWSCSVSL